MPRKLDRCVKKVKKKLKGKGNPFAICKAALKKKRMITSKNAGHSHTWTFASKLTSKNSGHRHKINFRTKKAMPNKKGGHSHKLLKKIKR